MTLLTKDSETNLKLVKTLIDQLHPMKVLNQITYAQAILEGALLSSPPSRLAFEYCNLFGMKPGFIPKGTATPGIVTFHTSEWVDGQHQIVEQPFLANLTIEDSINQHMTLLTGLSRYDKVVDATTFEEAAHAIYDTGYATDPQYVGELLSIYNEYIKVI